MTKNKSNDDNPRSRKKARTEKDKRVSIAENLENESDFSDTDKFSDDEEGGIRIDDIYIPPAPPPVCSYECSGPRLIITHIVNENFKSYAGKVVVGPFDKSFSSIVGPNGSGKSNVIDSMLFVFGYRATKIRSKKVSVLIHKSDMHQNVQSCKVEVHFVKIIDKENGEYEKIPGTDFVISRTAFQNNSSFYELNRKRVQFKDVAMTLRKHGIDLIHNRFLILQGEVEQIALMKPKAQNPHETGMLEYLEDIIGTTRYKEPIEKLQNKIDLLNEERQEKLSRLKIVESERKELKGPMEETIKFLKTENRIAHLKHKIYQLIMHKINKQLQKTEADKIAAVEKISKLKEQLESLHIQKGTDKQEMSTLNTFVQERMRKYEEKMEINKNSEKKNTGLTAEYNQLEKNQKKTADNLKSEEEKLKNLLKVPEKNTIEIEKLSEEEKELNKQRKEEESAFQTLMSSLRKETKNFQEEKDKLQAEQMRLQKIFDDTRSMFELAKSERDMYLNTEQSEKAKLDQLTSKLVQVTQSLEVKKTELKNTGKGLPEREQEMKHAEKELNEIKKLVSAITIDLRKQQSYLEEKKCSMSANRSRNRVQDFLMQQKREGKIPGIFGRLGDLGAINEKYDVAVSTAASSSLDYIIVDTKETIELCLKALKDGNIGRATFLALEKMQHFQNKCDRIPNTPENVPRLFDLIRVQDTRVRPAFYYALRETLVAENLDQATRIAYGTTRYRVVALGGELIEISGTMSGGGRQVMRGKMGSSVSVNTAEAGTADEVQKLEITVNNLQEKLNTHREKEKTFEEVIARCGPMIINMKMNINKMTIDVRALSKQKPELENQIKIQQNKVKESVPDAKKMKELEAKVMKAEKESQKAETEKKAIEAKVNTVHEKIMEITEGRTKTAQQKLEVITKKWEKTRSSITQLQVAIKTAERNAKKAQERIENMVTELKDVEKRFKEIEEEKKILQNECKTSSEEAAALKKQIDEKQVRLTELQEEHKRFLSSVQKLETAKVKEEEELESVEKKVSELKREIPECENKMKALTLHKIPIFEEPDDEIEDIDNEIAEGNSDKKSNSDESEVATEFKIYTHEELDEVRSDDLKEQLKNGEEYLRTLQPNLNTLQDYEKKTKQYIERTNELKEITERRNACKQGYEEARKNRHKEFMESFNTISNKLKELYQMLTMGGDAELDLLDSLDPFSEGINFCVRPPKKSWKNITNLSGGEKTLSSLALVFALHYYRPTPLYVMDEIDAALDFKNVSIVGYYIKERTKNAQFIVISLRTNMFELANMLTGIYKTYNCTKTMTIKPDSYCKKDVDQETIHYNSPRTINNRVINEAGDAKDLQEKNRSPSLNSSTESNKENNLSSINYSAIDEDSNDSQILRDADLLDL